MVAAATDVRGGISNELRSSGDSLTLGDDQSWFRATAANFSARPSVLFRSLPFSIFSFPPRNLTVSFGKHQFQITFQRAQFFSRKHLCCAKMKDMVFTRHRCHLYPSLLHHQRRQEEHLCYYYRNFGNNIMARRWNNTSGSSDDLHLLYCSSKDNRETLFYCHDSLKAPIFEEIVFI